MNSDELAQRVISRLSGKPPTISEECRAWFDRYPVTIIPCAGSPYVMIGLPDVPPADREEFESCFNRFYGGLQPIAITKMNIDEL